MFYAYGKMGVNCRSSQVTISNEVNPMRPSNFRIKACLFLCLLLSSYGLSAQVFYVVNSQSRTLSRIDLAANTINNSFASLGNVPNKIVLDGEHIWCVNSGDNAVQKISRLSGQTESNIFVGMGANPWDAVKHGDYLYVTGLVSGKVYMTNSITGSVVASLSVGTAPEALYIVGDKLYVSNTGNYANDYVGSSVAVINLESFELIKSITVNANPQYLSYLDGKLHVSCTGNWASIGGAICIIDTQTDQLVHTIDLGGTPGNILISTEEIAYVADSNGINLYSYDPVNYTVLHGSQDPIANGGSEIAGNSSLIAVLSPNWGSNGSLKIFNQDLSLTGQYTVAMTPTDLKMWIEPSSNEDAGLLNPGIRLYPNPVRMGGTLNIELGKPLKAELQIYNLRGQLISKSPVDGKTALNLPQELSSGIYLYKVMEGSRSHASGRFVISR
jgi:hypothetical protein